MDTLLAEGLIQCIDLLYESALDSQSWVAALQAINRLVNGSGALYLVFGSDNSLIRADCVDFPIEALQLYGVLYDQDVRREVVRRSPAHAVFNDVRLPDRKQFERTDVFNLVLKPYDMPNHVWSAIPQPNGAYGAMVVERSVRLGPAGAREEEIMRRLSPHVTRALQMQRVLGEQRSRSLLMEEVFERLPHPIALLSADGRVLRMSLALRELLRIRKGIFYSHGKLRARRLQDDTVLEKAIIQATRPSPTGSSSSTIVITEAAPGLGVVVTVYPLPPRPHVVDEARCLVVVRDPNGVAETVGRRLMQAYTLTKAEARLAETLLSGASLPEAADLLQVTVNTCKTQLQSIYRKTDCRNRAELARAIFALS